MHDLHRGGRHRAVEFDPVESASIRDDVLPIEGAKSVGVILGPAKQRVVAQTAMEQIAPGKFGIGVATGQHVVARPARKRIVARAAGQRIVASFACNHVGAESTAQVVAIRATRKTVVAGKAPDRVRTAIAKDKICQRAAIKRRRVLAIALGGIERRQCHAAEIGRRQLAAVDILKTQDRARNAVVTGQHDGYIRPVLHDLQTTALERVRGAGTQPKHVARITRGEIGNDVFGNIRRDRHRRNVTVDVATRAAGQRIDGGIRRQIGEDIGAIPAHKAVCPGTALDIVVQHSSGNGVVPGIAIQHLPADTKVGLHALDDFGDRQARPIGEFQHLDAAADQALDDGDPVGTVGETQRQIRPVQPGCRKAQVTQPIPLKSQRVRGRIAGLVDFQQAVAARKQIDVGPGAASCDVLPRSRIQRVGPRPTDQRVAVRTAKQEIITGEAGKRVSAVQTADRVSQSGAAQIIVRTRSRKRKGNQVVRIPDCAICKSHHFDAARDQRRDQRDTLFVRQPQDNVVPVALHTDIRRRDPRRKGQRVDPGQIVDEYLPRTRRKKVGVVACAALQCVGTGATCQRIGSFAAQQAVRPGATLQIVVAKLSAQGVVPGAPRKGIPRGATDKQIIALRRDLRQQHEVREGQKHTTVKAQLFNGTVRIGQRTDKRQAVFPYKAQNEVVTLRLDTQVTCRDPGTKLDRIGAG